MNKVPYVVLDTETTGLYPGLGHRVTEIAAIRYEDGKEVGRIDQLLNPQRFIDPIAIEISGITDEDVADKPLFETIAEPVLSLLSGAIIIAHSASFDAKFLANELWLAGFDRGERKPVLPNPWLCTLKLARLYFFFGRNNLSNIAHQMNIPVNRAHRALNDVYTTAKVFDRMIVEMGKQGFRTADEFLYAQGKPIYCPPPSAVKLPSTLQFSAENEHPVEIHYTSRNGRKVFTEIVTARYGIKHSDEAYLIAYSHDYKQQKSYLLNKIRLVNFLTPT